MAQSKGLAIGYWIATGLLCFMMAFNAFAFFALPQLPQEFARLGFPSYFRVELGIAKILGVLALLVPMAPPRLKEWAYAGMCINLISALIAHFALGDTFAQWSFAAFAMALWVASYMLWRRREASSA